MIENIKIILKSAETVYKTGDYTSATILYFKALFMILDYIILKSNGRTPKDHSERFRILQQNFPGLYEVLDKYFPAYRDSYTLTIKKNICEEVIANVKRIIKEYEIPVNN